MLATTRAAPHTTDVARFLNIELYQLTATRRLIAEAEAGRLDRGSGAAARPGAIAADWQAAS